MKEKIEIGTKLWLTEKSPCFTYCTELLVYTKHADSIFAVDVKGKTYHIIYENGKFDELDSYSTISFKINEHVDLITTL